MEAELFVVIALQKMAELVSEIVVEVKSVLVLDFAAGKLAELCFVLFVFLVEPAAAVFALAVGTVAEHMVYSVAEIEDDIAIGTGVGTVIVGKSAAVAVLVADTAAELVLVVVAVIEAFVAAVAVCTDFLFVG